MLCSYCLNKETCKRNKSNVRSCRLYNENTEMINKEREESKKRLQKAVQVNPLLYTYCKLFGVDVPGGLIEEEPKLPIKLKDYPAKSIYRWGYNGLSVRYNNDTENLDLNNLKENPNLEKILDSNIISQREFFGEKVLVIDYMEE